MLSLTGARTLGQSLLDVAAWDMIRDLVSSDPALNQAAWENLRGVVRLLEAAEAEPEYATEWAGWFDLPERSGLP